MSLTSVEQSAGWRIKAACGAADPDLFFPEPNTAPERIKEAKGYCAGCPVKQACLDEAFRTNEREAICGGLTPDEREQLLTPGMPMDRFQARRVDNRSARTIAVQHGSDVLVWLVKRQMTVDQVAERLDATPRAVYHAWLMLVPARLGEQRPLEASSVEGLLERSQE
ncbi:WhiB family transcriptional regulator, partial [Streptomyces sp. NPDC005969]|uniref:WhiB family transcriptional regulator n=1 Tax=Streptomyces sp. NPDC005969 TaxID=3156722 RepID=UPI0033C23752